MRISIFGLGYVGCVTAASLAGRGHDVIGVDVNEEKVRMIRAGTSPIIEPGLADLVAATVRSGHLSATTSVVEAVGRSDLAMICVGTPSGPHGQLDTSAVRHVIGEIASSVGGRSRFTMVLRSTVLPGTTDSTVMPLLRDLKISFALNPEFMREGTSLADFARPPMTLVGCDDDETAATLRMIYADVDAPFVHTTVKVAEMAKYVSNAFHALKVCFANEIADLCQAVGVDPQEVSRTFLTDHKLNISEAYLRPGFAFGGSCLPKDLRALLHLARRSDTDVPLLESILPSNDGQIRRAVDAVLNTRKKRIGIVGLAFKSGTDDLRESPMVALVETLIGKGFQISIYDPSVKLASLVGANRRYIEKEIPHISSLMCSDLAKLLDESEVIVLGSPGPETSQALAECRPGHVVIDLTRGAAGPVPRRKPAAA